MCHEAVRDLQGSFYVSAMDRLAELKEQVDHTSTVISILRDWQAVNEKQAARGDRANEKTSPDNC